MSRLNVFTKSKAQAVVEGLYKDLENRIVASPPGLCPVDISSSFLKLCHAQTCGKCVPCRVGLSQLQNLIEDVESLKWNCLDDNGKITFGKYKGLTPDELKEKDEGYLNWALSNIGGLYEKLFIDKHNVTRKELLDTKKQIKSKLSFSSDDWIKSSVQVNFDSYLDQYKYSCCAKKMDIETAVNETERYFQASK